MAAASAKIGSDEDLAAIEFHFGYWCPPFARCAASMANTGHVICHFAGPRGDVLVSVSADGTGKVTSSNPQPLEPTPSAG